MKIDDELKELRDDVKKIIERVAATDVKVSTYIDAFKQERTGAAEYRKEIRETLGDLTEQQTRTRAQVNALAANFSDERENTRKHYTDLTQVIAALSGSVKTLADKVADMKPTVDAMVVQRHEKEGERKYKLKQRAAVAGLIALITGTIGWLFEWWPKLGGLIKGVPPSPP